MSKIKKKVLTNSKNNSCCISAHFISKIQRETGGGEREKGKVAKQTERFGEKYRTILTSQQSMSDHTICSHN